MHIALWSTGYCRGFGGSEQMVNALLRRFHLEGLDTVLIADGDPGKVYKPYFSSLPDKVEIPTPTLTTVNRRHDWVELAVNVNSDARFVTKETV